MNKLVIPESARRAAPLDISQAQRLVSAVVREHLPRRYRSHADDIRQDCLLHLVGVWARFDPSRGCPSTFITTVSRRVLFRQLAKLKREPAGMSFNSDHAAPTASLRIDEVAEQIHTSPEKYMSTRQARAFRLLAGGADRHSIADSLGISPNSVTTLITRLRAKLVEHTA